MSLEPFLKYYQDELEFLVEGGKSLAMQYPDLAKSLDFSSFQSNDPDIQRLIESTAFLNARLQQRLDAQAPEIASEILHSIYPQFDRPTPSITIMEFSNLSQSNIKKLVPKNTLLSTSKEIDGQHYFFKTTMDVEVANCEIDEIEVVKNNTIKLPNHIYSLCDNAIRIQIKKSDLASVDNLTFHINLPSQIAYSVFEGIFSVIPDYNTPVFENGLQIGHIETVGFDQESSLLPTTSRENAAYKILTEFNIFPKKFMFFKVVFKIQPKSEMIIPFNCNKDIFLKKNNLLLNCTPAINLFEKNSEPININQKDTSYTIKADNNLNKNTEIYSVSSIEDTQFNSNKKYLSYFECNHFLDDDKHNIFWIMQRYQSKNLKHTENKILFIDSAQSFEKSVLYAKLLCLQKNANTIDAHESWNINSGNINLKCVNLDKPTEAMPPISDSRTQWRLISHLAINHFGIEGEHGLNYIKELLSIYNVQNQNNAPVISCLKSLEYASSMVYEDMCMLPKAQITLVADSNKSSKVFLLARVLGAFFGKTLSFNTKIDLELKKFENNKVWKSWKIV